MKLKSLENLELKQKLKIIEIAERKVIKKKIEKIIRQ